MTVQTMKHVVAKAVTSSNGVHSAALPPPKVERDVAVRRASGYLAMHIGLFFTPSEPILLFLGKPVWQMVMSYKVPKLDPIRVGFIEVDATTGLVEQITAEQKQLLIDKANAYLKFNASTATGPN